MFTIFKPNDILNHQGIMLCEKKKLFEFFSNGLAVQFEMVN